MFDCFMLRPLLVGEAVRRDVWASRPSSDTNACALCAADYSQIFVNAVHGILPGANR